MLYWYKNNLMLQCKYVKGTRATRVVRRKPRTRQRENYVVDHCCFPLKIQWPKKRANEHLASEILFVFTFRRIFSVPYLILSHGIFCYYIYFIPFLYICRYIHIIFVVIFRLYICASGRDKILRILFNLFYTDTQTMLPSRSFSMCRGLSAFNNEHNRKLAQLK
jgi:hypothetical protein